MCPPPAIFSNLLESAKGVISLESSMIQDVTDGCAVVLLLLNKDHPALIILRAVARKF